MSKFEIRYTLKREIKRVNKLIDQKILRGLPYTRESRLHKDLKARLGLLEKTTFLGRSMRFVSLFMF
jgi:hypothetical protein